MDVALIQVPYDSGHREQRMGLGPGTLLRHGAPARIEAAGGRAVAARIDTDEAFPKEIAVAFDLAGKLSGEVARARRQGAFPLVLAGNCMSAVGTLAGLAEVPRLGIVWLDAHGDMKTPETTTNGFLDGMALAVVLGDCWCGMARRVPGFRPVPESAALLLGVQRLDACEAERLQGSGIEQISGPDLRAGGAAAVAEALDRMAGRADAFYLHLDMDVHGSGELRANASALPDGPTPEQLRGIAAAVCRRLPVVAAGLTAYDPACDTDGAAAESALALIGTVVGSLAARRA